MEKEGINSELMYSFNTADSLRIFPKKVREPLSKIALSNPIRVVRRALNASEKELKYMMDIANRRLAKAIKLIEDKEDMAQNHEQEIFDIVSESIKSGEHLVKEVFIPEYLGFMEIPPEGEEEIRIYAKEGYSVTRFDDRWLICAPDQTRILILIPSMRDAITILTGLGMDLTFKGYIAGEYNNDTKSLEESIHKVIKGIVKKRKDWEGKIAKKK